MYTFVKTAPLAIFGLIVVLTSAGCEVEFHTTAAGNLDFERGNKALDEGNLDTAWTAYSQCLSVNPRHFDARFNRSLVFYRRGEFARALVDLDACLKQDNRSVVALTARARVRVDQSDFTAAIADCNEVLRIDPQDRHAHIIRGTAAAKRGDHPHALADFTEGLRRNADHPEPFMYHNLAVINAVTGDLRQAIVYESKAVELASGEEKERFEAGLRELNLELNPEI